MSEIEVSTDGRVSVYLPYHFAKISAQNLQKIISVFGNLESALQQPLVVWQQHKLLTAKQLERLFSEEMPDKIEQALQWQQQQNQSIITLESQYYPSLLKEIADPPILLYVLGGLEWLSAPQLAIVGSRNSSKYGQSTAEDFAQYLAGIGLTITSGLASGIDRSAHQGALNSGQKGSTIAVVATGLDRVYPASNRQLAHQIAENGAIISEYPLESKPNAYHFPERNRLISGLSVGTLVVEAAAQSGSLITARQAMEQGREVFAVPGSIHSTQSKGCHQLIRQGAKLVESGQDVLEDLSPLISLTLADQTNGDMTEEQTETKGLMQWIDFEPVSLDELVVLSRQPVSSIQGELIMLELEGKVESLSANRYRRLK